MTDRELLELAAKVAGFGSPSSGDCCWTESEYPKGSGLKGALWNYVGWGQDAELWNPLTDDGDALRLAVKLHISLDHNHPADHDLWVCASHHADHSGGFFVDMDDETHRQSATRRAITGDAVTLAKGEGKV